MLRSMEPQEWVFQECAVCNLKHLEITNYQFVLFTLGPECASFPVQGKGKASLLRQGIDNEPTRKSVIDLATECVPRPVYICVHHIT